MTSHPRGRPWLSTTSGAPAADADTWVVRVPGSSITTAGSLFRTVKDPLEFPDYFGANWAAFDECLGDLLDLSEGGMGSAFGGRTGRAGTSLDIVVDDAEDVLSDEPETVLRTLVEIVRDHASTAAHPTTASLSVHLRCRGSQADRFAALRRAGVRPEDLMP